ncbi:MAG: YeeE/YedE thiosulfate transporter family protein [Gemmatimonadota bacterium]
MPHPLPWYIAGPLIGLMVPILLLIGNKAFGISSNLRHICSAVAPCGIEFFGHNWKKVGLWNLVFVAGVFVGAAIIARLAPPTVTISPDTVSALQAIGVQEFGGLAPHDLFSWSALLTLRGAIVVIVGGFCVGFGASYAGGCTSGHAISGLADLQPASFIAVLGFFAGGLLTTYLILPRIL